MITLYHSTSDENAGLILYDKFKDFELSIPGLSGVWFSDRPLTDCDGLQQSMDFCFAVAFDEDVSNYFVHEQDRPNNEYLIPAAIANKYVRRRVYADERDRLIDAWFERHRTTPTVG